MKTKRTKTTEERIANHPMYSPSDLKYLRNKGYTDDEIIAFWDRDHGMGHKPVEHTTAATHAPQVAMYDAGNGRKVTVPENDESDLFDAIRE